MRVRQNIQAVHLYQESRVADPGNAWVDEAGAEGGAIIGDARRVEAPRRSEVCPESANNKAPAGPARRAAELRVGVAKAARDVMRWAAGQWLRPDARAG